MFEILAPDNAALLEVDAVVVADGAAAAVVADCIWIASADGNCTVVVWMYKVAFDCIQRLKDAPTQHFELANDYLQDGP